MPEKLTEADWESLMVNIKNRQCLPFIGAGANQGIIPLGHQIAEAWADEYKYPLEDRYDLSSVAQFIAVRTNNNISPLQKMQQLIEEKQKESNMQCDTLIQLASLPLPIFITSNYDDLLWTALKKDKNPARELCGWNSLVRDGPSVYKEDPGFEPSPDKPMLYHLHGHHEDPQSMVLTEDNYLDFLLQINKRQDVIPSDIKGALSKHSLLFIGYRMSDWNFRIIYRTLLKTVDDSLRQTSIAVQLPPGDAAALTYLTDYFRNQKVHVYWGDALEFVKELRDRWSAFRK
jgi:hypothetical protein